MPLTKEELKEARRASREVEWFEKRGRIWFAYGAALLNVSLALLGKHSTVFKALAGGMVVALVGLGVFRWIDNRRLRARYAANVELLRVLSEREPDLPGRIGDPFAYKPLFDAWNRRVNRRPLLWRLDRFLMGRGWESGVQR